MARRERQQAPGEKLRGELMSFVVKSNDYWGLGEVRTTHDGGIVKVKGKLLGCTPGDTVELEGTWETHARYGRQFKVHGCTVVVPQDASGVVGWLAAKLPQISRRRAEALVAQHGVDGTWRILDDGDVVALCAIEGITEPRAEEILAAYQAQKGDRDRVVRLKGYGLTDSQIAKLLKAWGDDAEKKLKENPYLLVEQVESFGWARADAVAQRMGLPRDSQARLGAGCLHAMKEAAQAGHCYVAQGKLAAIVATKVCGVDEAPVREAIKSLVDAGKLVRHGTNLYLKNLAAAEEQLAEVFSARAAGVAAAEE